MSLDEVRDAIRERILEKQKVSGSSAIMTDINKAIQSFPELTLRERDFAFRSSIENRTIYQWAALYNCSYHTIYYMIHNPRVKQLVEEIQFNVRKYAVGMQMLLLREAMMQYLKIFRAPENGDTIDAKRMAAKEIMGSAGMIKNAGEEGGTKIMNVNILGASASEELNDPESSGEVTITVAELEKEMNEFKQIEDMRSKVVAHEKKIKGKELHNHGGGFEGETARSIEVE